HAPSWLVALSATMPCLASAAPGFWIHYASAARAALPMAVACWDRSIWQAWAMLARQSHCSSAHAKVVMPPAVIWPDMRTTAAAGGHRTRLLHFGSTQRRARVR